MQRHLEGLIPFSRRALSAALRMGTATDAAPLAVDATAGNGHDTLFLAAAIGDQGRVWAFDVQEAALGSAKNLLAATGPDIADRVAFIHGGHETAGRVLPGTAAGHVWAVTFNLGYLPGGDKTVVTLPETTLGALSCLSGMLAPGGILSVHSYRGHEGGRAEGDAVAAWFGGLPWETWRVAEYGFCNKPRNGEILFLAERLA